MAFFFVSEGLSTNTHPAEPQNEPEAPLLAKPFDP
jgi:hypothetical protein